MEQNNEPVKSMENPDCAYEALPSGAEIKSFEMYADNGGDDDEPREDVRIDYFYDSSLDGIVIVGCSGSMREIHLPCYDADEKPVVKLGDRFFGCPNATYIALPDTVTEIGDEAFTEYMELEDVDLPKSLTKMGNSIFYRCESLNGITIPDGVTEISDAAFCGCKALKYVDFNNGLTKIGSGAFAGCEELSRIEIPDTVTEIGNYAFRDCEWLGNFTIPDSVAIIGTGAFCGCTRKLTSVTIPDSVVEIGGGAFSNCCSLTEINISKDNQWFSFADDMLFRKHSDGSAAILTCLTKTEAAIIPDNVTVIGDCAFCGCVNLTSATIPDSVTEIGVYAFENCTSLTSVTIPDSVTEIGETAFEGCKKIQATYKGKTYDFEHINDLYKAINGN